MKKVNGKAISLRDDLKTELKMSGVVLEDKQVGNLIFVFYEHLDYGIKHFSKSMLKRIVK